MYNLENDQGEVKNLAKAMPDLFQALMANYISYTEKFKVLGMFDEYEAVKEVENKFKRKIINVLKPWLLGLAGLLIIWFIRRRRKKKEQRN